MKEFDSLDLLIQRIFRFIGQIGIVVIISMMLLIVTDVAGRYFFNRPIVGSIEIVELQNIILSFFALIWCTLNMEHIKVTVFEKYIPAKVKSFSDTVYYLLGASFYTFICIQNIKILHEYVLKGTETDKGLILEDLFDEYVGLDIEITVKVVKKNLLVVE